jgi:hypothetical protein
VCLRIVLVYLLSHLVVAGALWGQELSSSAAYHPMVAAVHVHSTASTGTLTLEALAERAERLGIDAILLTENLVLRYEYGLRPFEQSVKVQRSFPSLAMYGIGRYLREVAAVQARHPTVLLIPGVEVAPHYYWTGSLFGRNLTMHDAQRNLLIFGLMNEAAYRTLPALGNEESYGTDRRWFAGLLPVLLFGSAIWMGYPRSRSGLVNHTANRRSGVTIGLALLMMVVSGILLYNAWPLREPAFSQYDEDLGFRPYQALIGRVALQGAVALWSLPEAKDFRTVSFGPLGTVTIKTDPHPDALMLTEGYAGFGGLYQEARSAQVPGGIWDQLINLYQTKQRPQRPAMVGEIAFHSPDHAEKELDQVLTVLWVQQRTPEGILDALRQGRAYAVERYAKGFRLQLDEFQINTDSSPFRTTVGSVVRRIGAEPVRILVRLSATDQAAHPVTLRVIRSGQVLATNKGRTPLEFQMTDETITPDQPAAYRLEAAGGGVGELLSNPIYIEPFRGQG